jgi:predicted dehydrogenase
MDRRAFLGVSAASLLPRREPIRVGQIGTAHGHADGKMRTIRKLSETFQVVGVASDDAVALKRPAYHDVPRLPEEELLAKAELLVVETAVDQLVPTALRCVAAGKHVHLDKPPGPSLPLFRKLLGLAAEKKRLVQLGYMFRYNPAFQLALKAARDGRLGALIEIDGVIGKKSSPAERPSHAPDPGGTMYELGCHLIDALIALAGPPERVHAHGRKGADGRAENQLAVFEYPGFCATIRSQITDPFGSARRSFSVAGTKGFLDIRPLEPPQAVLGIEGEGAKPQSFPPAGGRYDAEFLDLAAAIRGEKALPFDAAHDLAVHEAVLRASGMAVD